MGDLMELIPLLKAKLMVPEIPQAALLCDRIKSLRIASCRATIMTAPAGYGKTTAVLLALRKYRAQMHWYRLEKEDCFLPIFYAHLISTLFGQGENAVSDSARSLESIDAISKEYSLLNAVICQEAWARFTDSRGEYIILDDFQHVCDCAAIVETITYFIANMPPCVHIVVISRSATGLRLEKLSLTQDIEYVDESALHFTKAEIGKLVAARPGNVADSNHIQALYEFSEGWIAGIMLMLHASQSAFREEAKYIHTDRQSIFAYLLEEACAGVEDKKVRVLAQMAIFADFTCGDLTAVLGLGLADAQELVTWLETRNLFIQKISTVPPCYRFHSLFQYALHSMLHNLFSEEEVIRLHLAAAKHFEKEKDYCAAIRHLLLAGQTTGAVQLATSAGQGAMDEGDIDQAVAITQAIPEALGYNNATLLMLRGVALIAAESEQSFALLEQSLALARKEKKYHLQIGVEGLLISLCIQKGNFKAIGSIITKPPPFHVMVTNRTARRMLPMSLFTKLVITDQLRPGRLMGLLVGRIGKGQSLWDYSNCMTRGTLCYRSGHFAQAPAIQNDILNHPVARINDRWRALGLSICIHMACMSRDRESLLQLTEELASIGEKYASGYAISYALYFRAHAKYQARDTENAMLLIRQAETAFARYHNPMMAQVCQLFHFLWQMEETPARLLADRIYTALSQLQEQHPSLGFGEFGQIVTGVCARESGDFAGAEALLYDAYQASRLKGAWQSMCAAAMHLADLYYQRQDFSREFSYLRVVGRLAARNGYIYFREVDYPTLVRVCARCVANGIARQHMLSVIQRTFSVKDADRLQQNPADAARNPRAFMTGCQKLPKAQKPTVYACLFGEFRLTANGESLATGEWKTRKICGILKYILAHPGTIVTREALAAAFWPESDSRAAHISLRVALFELRKILARAGMAIGSDNAFVEERKDGFFFKISDIVKTDVDHFMTLYHQSKKADLAPRTLAAILAEMVALYRGDFFGDDDYDEWVALSRAHYKSIFIECSHRLVALQMQNGEADQAEELLVRHMRVDPYDEKACGLLVRLYRQNGRNDQAAALRRQFEKRFLAEMGVPAQLDVSFDAVGEGAAP